MKIGNVRCMDCRCNSGHDCDGESPTDQITWLQTVDNELMPNSKYKNPRTFKSPTCAYPDCYNTTVGNNITCSQHHSKLHDTIPFKTRREEMKTHEERAKKNVEEFQGFMITDGTVFTYMDTAAQVEELHIMLDDPKMPVGNIKDRITAMFLEIERDFL